MIGHGLHHSAYLLLLIMSGYSDAHPCVLDGHRREQSQVDIKPLFHQSVDEIVPRFGHPCTNIEHWGIVPIDQGYIGFGQKSIEILDTLPQLVLEAVDL